MIMAFPLLKPCRGLRIGERPFSYHAPEGHLADVRPTKQKEPENPFRLSRLRRRGASLAFGLSRFAEDTHEIGSTRRAVDPSGEVNGNAGVPKLRHSIIALERSPRRWRSSQYLKGRNRRVRRAVHFSQSTSPATAG